MMDPSAKPTTLDSDSHPVKLTGTTGPESLTEGYGDNAASSRTLGGDIDFFSTIGTERKRNKPSESSAVGCFFAMDRYQVLIDCSLGFLRGN
jgi:hypothetical protein